MLSIWHSGDSGELSDADEPDIAGVKPLPGRFLDFLHPLGNRIEIVGYDNIQFTKAPDVVRGMGRSRGSRCVIRVDE
jgi:hypothetical protein